MAFGLGNLKLSPAELWSMTPRELAAACTPHVMAADLPPRRGDLDRLLQRYPDHQGAHHGSA